MQGLQILPSLLCPHAAWLWPGPSLRFLVPTQRYETRAPLPNGSQGRGRGEDDFFELQCYNPQQHANEIVLK